VNVTASINFRGMVKISAVLAVFQEMSHEMSALSWHAIIHTTRSSDKSSHRNSVFLQVPTDSVAAVETV
jgi:hypothetical protein